MIDFVTFAASVFIPYFVFMSLATLACRSRKEGFVRDLHFYVAGIGAVATCAFILSTFSG